MFLSDKMIHVIANLISGNKAKGRISKRVFQENKARQVFRKTNIFYPPGTHTYVYVSGGKKCLFWENWRALFSSSTRFEVPEKLQITIFNLGLSPVYRRITTILESLQA